MDTLGKEEQAQEGTMGTELCLSILPVKSTERLGEASLPQADRLPLQLGSTLPRALASEGHVVTQCVCAYSQTREFTPAHMRAHTHTRLPLPTRRSFSFCSWKASTVSARWWVERLVSTEALCALVSAWAQGHRSRKCHRVSLAPRYYSGSFSVLPSPVGHFLPPWVVSC